MMESGAELEALLRRTLTRLNDFGVKKVLLFSGHFPDEQLAMIDRLAAEWNLAGMPMHALASAVNRIPGLSLGSDHAGMFETALLYAMHPELVDISRLPKRRAGEKMEKEMTQMSRTARGCAIPLETGSTTRQKCRSLSRFEPTSHL